MTNLKTGISGVLILAGLGGLLMIQHQSIGKAREENEALKQQLDQAALLAAENERLSNQLAQASSPGNEQQTAELLRLRGEVGMLRRQTNEAARLRMENHRLQEALANSAAAAKANSASAEAQNDPAKEQEKAAMFAKMSDAKILMLGMVLFAQDHQGQTPSKLEDAKPYFGDSLTQTNDFEKIYDGSLQNLPNASTLIVVREVEAHQELNGKWVRAYGFADGHSEIHVTPDNNFAPWEQQHGLGSAPSQQPSQ